MADTFIKRLKGLMFIKKPPDYLLVFHPCNSIHTFFMRIQIDVLFLDSDLVVVKKIEGLKKNRVIMPVAGAKYVIEGRQGSFKQIAAGDCLSLC